MTEIDIDKIANEITNALTNYSEQVTNATKKAIDKTATKAQEIVSNKAPIGKAARRYTRNNKKVLRQAGKYKKHIIAKTAYEDKYDKRDVICVKPNEHALAHLLENGHALRQGGRAKAQPHFAYGQEYIVKNLESNIEKEMDSIDV